MSEKKLGIIVLNYNTYDETVECINSIKEYTKLPYKVYLVDNASPDGSGTQLKTFYKDDDKVEVILCLKNSGYSAGNNVGIRQASLEGCNYIFIVNSDVELLNNAFDRMVKTLESDDAYMMIGPSVMDNNDCETQIPRKKLSFKIFVLARHPFCDIPVVKKWSNRLYDVPKEGVFAFEGSVSGCCFGIKTEDFERIRLFDEHVFLYSEEDILAYKMSKIGKKAVVDPDARVWHKANVSTKKEGNAFVQYHRWISVFYMLKAYAGINKLQQIFVALWNTLTWVVLSVVSKGHRKMLKGFWKQNWHIVADKGDE